jgi:hypothetical protein
MDNASPQVLQIDAFGSGMSLPEQSNTSWKAIRMRSKALRGHRMGSS